MVRTICYPVCILALVPSLAWAAWAETDYIVDSPYYTYKLDGAKMLPDGSVSATRTYVRRVQPPAIYTGPIMPDKLRIGSIVTKANVAKLIRGGIKGGVYGVLATWAFDEFIEKYGIGLDDDRNLGIDGGPIPGYQSGKYWQAYFSSNNYGTGHVDPAKACDNGAKALNPAHRGELAFIPQNTEPYVCNRYQGTTFQGNIGVALKTCSGSTTAICSHPSTSFNPISDDVLIPYFEEFDKSKNGTQLPKLLTRPDGLAVRTPDAITTEDNLKDQWNTQTGDNLDGATANNPTWDSEYYNPNGTLKDPQIAAGNGTPSSTTTTTTTNPSTGETTTTTTTTPGSSPSSDTEWPEFCTWAPVVCSALEWLTADHEFDDAPAVDVTTTEQPTYSSGLGSGVCPAPIHVDLAQYGAVDIEYTMLCDLVTRLRPLLLVLFYISGVYIVIRSN